MCFLLLVFYCLYFSKIKRVDEWNKKYKIAKYLKTKMGSCRNSETSVWIIQLCCVLCVVSLGIRCKLTKLQWKYVQKLGTYIVVIFSFDLNIQFLKQQPKTFPSSTNMLYVDLSQRNYLTHERNITGNYMGLFYEYLRVSITCIFGNIHKISQNDFPSNILDPPAHAQCLRLADRCIDCYMALL